MVTDPDNTGALDQLVRAVFSSARAQIVVLASGTRLALAELKLVACRAGLAVGILIVIAGTVLVGWVMALILGALILHAQGLSPVLATLVMLVLHLCGLTGLLLFLRQTLKQITFEHTRQALQGSPAAPATTDVKIASNASKPKISKPVVGNPEIRPPEARSSKTGQS